MRRVHLCISGDVQGVGYRGWVRGVARDMGLVGWEKNTDDDRVEVVAEGEREGLEELVTACRQGPDVAWVEKIDVTWEKATDELVGFEVVY
ncbi:acylphosphatase [Candidatus Gottesmanbacteria bacterium]|nr:acylphosphatase [Candidatus Gottesmanbacteria bacterium]